MARPPALTAAGGAAVIAGLALFATALWRLQRRSLQRARWAIRWYQACAMCLGLGAVLGILMARGAAWSHGSLLGAHLSLNLAGWLGTAIVGTLHTFYPSLTHTRRLTALVAVAVAALALSRVSGLEDLGAPAAVALLAAAMPIAGRILALATRAVLSPQRIPHA